MFQILEIIPLSFTSLRMTDLPGYLTQMIIIIISKIYIDIWLYIDQKKYFLRLQVFHGLGIGFPSKSSSQ